MSEIKKSRQKIMMVNSILFLALLAWGGIASLSMKKHPFQKWKTAN